MLCLCYFTFLYYCVVNMIINRNFDDKFYFAMTTAVCVLHYHLQLNIEMTDENNNEQNTIYFISSKI